MKIRDVYEKLNLKYKNKLKIIRKGIFWILLEEEAFFMANYFNFKITSLDKKTIKIGFPNSSKEKWLKILREKNIGYILIDKDKNDNSFNYQVVKGKYYSAIYPINLEDFNLTKNRILGLKKLDIEAKNEKNFLLQIKVEELYIILSQLLIRLPKKERFYFRSKIETLFLDILENIYKYKYNLGSRTEIIDSIFSNVIVIREFCKMLYNIGIITKETIYLKISDEFVDVLKICRGIKNKKIL